MFDSLIQLIPPQVAVGIIVLVLCFQFFFAVGKIVYSYITKKWEEERIDELKEMIQKNTDNSNQNNVQIGIIIAHYESEQRFRMMLEERISEIEHKILGNGKPSLSTEIELLKLEVKSLKEKIK